MCVHCHSSEWLLFEFVYIGPRVIRIGLFRNRTKTFCISLMQNTCILGNHLNLDSNWGRTTAHCISPSGMASVWVVSAFDWWNLSDKNVQGILRQFLRIREKVRDWNKESQKCPWQNESRIGWSIFFQAEMWRIPRMVESRLAYALFGFGNFKLQKLRRNVCVFISSAWKNSWSTRSESWFLETRSSARNFTQSKSGWKPHTHTSTCVCVCVCVATKQSFGLNNIPNISPIFGWFCQSIKRIRTLPWTLQQETTDNTRVWVLYSIQFQGFTCLDYAWDEWQGRCMAFISAEEKNKKIFFEHWKHICATWLNLFSGYTRHQMLKINKKK